MSATLPSGWNFDDEADVDKEHAHNPSDFVLNIHVNEQSGITCVDLPWYDPNKPRIGTKPAREVILKLLTGKCNDVKPLNFRGKYENDKVTEDPYYKLAPGWSTLSGGRHPQTLFAPSVIVPLIVQAADCVAFIAETRIFIVSGDPPTKTEVTIDELRARNIKTKPVPNMYKKTLAAGMVEPNSAALNIQPIINQMDGKIGIIAEKVDTQAATIDKLETLMATLIGTVQRQAPLPPPTPPQVRDPADKNSEDAPTERRVRRRKA